MCCDETRASLARYSAAGKSIWINETNAPPSDDPQEPPWSEPRFRVSLDEQAAFVLQEFALAFSHGAERVEFYKLRNSADHLRVHRAVRPAARRQRAAARLRRLPRGDDLPQRLSQCSPRAARGDINAVTFDRGDTTTTVLWTDGTAPRQVRVAAIAANALLVDERGNTMPISAVRRRYTHRTARCGLHQRTQLLHRRRAAIACGAGCGQRPLSSGRISRKRNGSGRGRSADRETTCCALARLEAAAAEKEDR